MYAKSGRVGRTLQYPTRITLPLADGVTEQIDGLCEEGEPRLDFIRAAIEREIKRRERDKRHKPNE